MKKLLFVVSILVASALSALGQTATVTPSVSNYSATGGTVTFTVNISYTGTQTALGFDILKVPAGWSFVSSGGTNPPQFPPSAGDTGEFDFFYTSIPASPVSFTFTAAYPAGLTGPQAFQSVQLIVRPASSTPIAVPDITIQQPPVAPTITTNPTSLTTTYGSTVSFSGAASGFPAPTYQWQYNNANLTEGGRFSGTTTANLQIAGVLIADAGPYTLVATNSQGSATSTAANLTVNKANQTITFNGPPTHVYGDAPFALTASSTSGLGVTFTSSNTNVATVINGMVSIVGAGTTTLTANQAGDGNYNAASAVPQTLTVNKAPASVTLGGLSAVYDGTPKAVTATTNPPGLAVTITYNGSATAPTAVGSYTVAATVADNNYAGGSGNTLTISASPQTITFGALTPVTFGSSPVTLGATASSGLAVSYTSSDSTVATVSGNTLTIVGAGTATITASQAGNGNFTAATPVPQTLTVNKAAATVTLGNLAPTYTGSPIAATATTNPVGLTVVFTYDGSATAPTAVKTGGYAVVGTISDKNYTGSAAGTMTIAKANQTVTFGTLNPVTFGAAPFSLSATASSNLGVIYASTNSTVALVNGSTVTVVGAGTTTIVASQPGDTNFNAATDVPQTLTVNQASQTITFGALTPVAFGAAPFSLGATASSNLGVTYTSSNTGVATVSGSTVTIIGAGTTTITAMQAGNTNFLAASNVPQTLTVNKASAGITLGGLSATYDGNPHAATVTTTPASLNFTITYDGGATVPTNAGSHAVAVTINDANYSGSTTGSLVIAQAPQTITFGALPAATFGDSAITLGATASSGLGVTYASSNPAVATVSGSTLTIVGAGSTTITASQAGNTNYLAATSVPQTLAVNKATATVTLNPASLTVTYDTKPKAVTATTAPANLTVNFTYNGNATAPTLAGTYPVVATVVDANYVGATTGTLTISKANQTITFAALPSQSINTSLTLTATASSGLPVTYTTSDSTATTLNGSVLTLNHTGAVTITAKQGGDNNYNAAPDVAQPLTILNQGQTITFAALPNKTFGDAPITLTATATSTLPVTFASSNTTVATVTGTTLTITGAGTTNITASQAGSADFAAAPDVVRTLTVAKAAATVTLSSLAATYDGTPKAVTVTTNPASLNTTVSYVAGGAGSATPPTEAGTYPVTATIAEANYTGSATGTLVIAQAPQTITFAALGTKLLNAAPFALTGTASSNLTVTYLSSNLKVATVSGSTVTVVGVGTTTISASQAGNNDYLPAPVVTQNLLVNPVAPVIVSTPSTTATVLAGGSFAFGPITLNALSSPATFSLSSNPTLTGLSANATSGNISGTIPANTAPGTYMLTLTVQNATGSDSKTITLTVQAPAPVFSSAAAAAATAGTAFTYTPAASGSPTFTISGTLPSWLTFNGTALTGTPTAAGSYTVNIVATNGTGSVTLPLTIGVTLPANAPAYSGTSVPSWTAGAAATFTPNFGAGTGATVYAMTGTLPTGLSFNSSTGAISGTPTQSGMFPITISATRAGVTATATLTVTVNPAASAPVVTFPGSGNAISATVGVALPSYTVGASPATGATFAATGLPPGVTITAGTGLISGTPTSVGTYQVHITATSSTAGTGAESILVITVSASASAPAISSPALVLGQVGVTLTPTYTVLASNSPTSYAMVGTLPAGLTFNAGSSTVPATVTGTPSASGDVHVFFVATNASGDGPPLDVDFKIAPASTVPAINSNGTATGQVGQAFSYTITASNSPTGFSSTTLPDGLTLNAASGVISGVPSTATTAGSPASVTLTATNASGTGTAATLLITIAPAPATPVVTSGNSAAGQVGTAFSYQMAASAGATSFSATGLPAGLAVAPATGLISGTPTQAGVFTVSLTAANSAGLGTASTLTITIAAAAQAASVTSAPSASGTVGTAFTYQTTAAPVPITSYALTGTLPLGLTFNSSTGAIAGTPAQAGSFNVTLTAANATGAGAPQALAITIAPAAGTPVITSPGTASANVGTPFSYTITAAAPFPTTAPFAAPNTLDATNLPADFAENPRTGVISGTPTVTGNYTVSLSGTNASGTGPSRPLVINVAASTTAPVISSPAAASAQAGVAFTYQIDTVAHNATSYQVLNAPVWMTFDRASGAIAGTPTTPGQVVVQLVASNTSGASNPQTLTLTVAAAAGTPVVSSAHSVPAFKVGQVFAGYTITTSPASTSFLVTGLPTGMTYDATTGVISGTPTVSGLYQVSISGINAQGQGASVLLTINVLPSGSFGS